MQMNHELTPTSTLEQIRPRLTQLTYALTKLENQLLAVTPTNELTNIQNQLNVALQQLDSFAKAIQNNKEVLNSTTVFPNAEFDTNSNILPNLLRKKLTPEVQSWISSTALIDFQDWDETILELVEYAESELEECIFTGHLTKNEIERGQSFPLLDQLDSAQHIDDNQDAAENSNINLITRFIYQGLDA